METLFEPISQFNKLPLLRVDKSHVRIFNNKEIIKICDNSLNFLYALKCINLEHFNTPTKVLQLIRGTTLENATVSPYLRDYQEMYYFNFDKYSSKDILILFKNILKSVSKAHDNDFYINDIHGKNILLNKYLDYKFFDFDLSVINGIEFDKRRFPNKYRNLYGQNQPLTKTVFKINDLLALLHIFLNVCYCWPRYYFSPQEPKMYNSEIISTLNFSPNVENYFKNIYEKKTYPDVFGLIDAIDELMDYKYDYKVKIK